MKAKLIIFLVVNYFCKAVSQNCVCGVPSKRAVRSGKSAKNTKISIEEHPWQILIEIIFHDRSKAMMIEEKSFQFSIFFTFLIQICSNTLEGHWFLLIMYSQWQVFSRTHLPELVSRGVKKFNILINIFNQF